MTEPVACPECGCFPWQGTHFNTCSSFQPRVAISRPAPTKSLNYAERKRKGLS